MQKRTRKRENESGNVLFYILIAVALFGALGYVVSNMMRGGDADMIGDEQAKLYAGEILDYARVVRGAVQDIRISNGCADTDIRFISTATTGYGTSVRSACDVFDIAGGDVKYTTPIAEWGGATEWLFVGSNTVDGVGTASPDLVIVLQNIPERICTEINNKSGVAAIVDDTDGVDYSKFTGTFASTEQIDAASSASAACINDTTTGGNYTFYQVIVKR